MQNSATEASTLLRLASEVAVVSPAAVDALRFTAMHPSAASTQQHILRLLQRKVSIKSQKRASTNIVQLSRIKSGDNITTHADTAAVMQVQLLLIVVCYLQLRICELSAAAKCVTVTVVRLLHG
jgi:hypothetical protein